MKTKTTTTHLVGGGRVGDEPRALRQDPLLLKGKPVFGSAVCERLGGLPGLVGEVVRQRGSEGSRILD